MPLRHGNAIDYIRNDRPKCPHCDALFDIEAEEAWHLYDQAHEEEILECPACEKEFVVTVQASYTFSTDEQFDDEEPATVGVKP